MILIAAIGSSGERELRGLFAECEGLSDERITVFRKDNATSHAPAPAKAVTFSGTAPASSSYGTSVPGMTRTLALGRYPAQETADYLKDTRISHDAAHHYNAAIDEGRSVVTYDANVANASLVEAQFRACGLLRVRRFVCAD